MEGVNLMKKILLRSVILLTCVLVLVLAGNTKALNQLSVYLPLIFGGYTETPVPSPEATQKPLECDLSYPTVCIPPPPPILNCDDIPYTNFVVLPPDPHNFDDDDDGIGCELGVYNYPPYSPYNPSPSNGAIGISPRITLSWSGGDPITSDSVTSDVYIGESSPPSNLVCNDIDRQYCIPDNLENNIMYYWQVIATDGQGLSSEGQIWEFTTTSLCIPSLISPEEGMILDNGRLDSEDSIRWDFNWSNCPGATQYQLFVEHTGALYPVINTNIEYGSSYLHERNGHYIIDKNRFDWNWKVRAWIDGKWGDWSVIRMFDVEPVNTDQSNCIPYPLTELIFDNGRRDHQDSIIWSFNWTSCPGATYYHLRVVNSDASTVLIEEIPVFDNSFSYECDGCYFDAMCGWVETNALIDGNWSDTGTAYFCLEPVDTDPPR